jgi:hypothetical protein
MVQRQSEIYREFELVAVQALMLWQCAAYPTRLGLPVPRPDDVFTAPTKDAALAQARELVDRLLSRH